MTKVNPGDENKDTVPPVTPPQTPTNPPTPPVGDSGDGSGDTDFEKELENLENNGGKPPISPDNAAKDELKQAIFTGKSIVKRIKGLGGDARSIMSDDEQPDSTPPVPPVIDTSRFVTKLDLARADAAKLAKSDAELKVIMWRVEHQGMSVEDAHFLANKGKISKTLSEINRTKAAVPGTGGGPGERQADEGKVPPLTELQRKQIERSDMKFDPTKKAYVGKKVQLRYDDTAKDWVVERL